MKIPVLRKLQETSGLRASAAITTDAGRLLALPDKSVRSRELITPQLG